MQLSVSNEWKVNILTIGFSTLDTAWTTTDFKTMSRSQSFRSIILFLQTNVSFPNSTDQSLAYSKLTECIWHSISITSDFNPQITKAGKDLGNICLKILIILANSKTKYDEYALISIRGVVTYFATKIQELALKNPWAFSAEMLELSLSSRGFGVGEPTVLSSSCFSLPR